MIKDSPIFIFMSSPRSGSTWLQRMLTSTKEVLIWGEHNLFSRLWIHDDYPGDDVWTDDLIESNTSNSNNLHRFRTFGPNMWMALMLPFKSDLDKATKAFMDVAFASAAKREGYDRWGFKVSGWDRKFIKFLQRHYPSSRMIFITRKFLHCYQSNFNAVNTDGKKEFIKNWIYKNNLILRICKKQRNAKLVRYEDLLQDENEISRLIQWCGIWNIPNPNVINTYISKPVSYDPFTESDIKLINKYKSKINTISNQIGYPSISFEDDDRSKKAPIITGRKIPATKEIALNVCTGVGDTFWVYQKFAPHFDNITFNICQVGDTDVQARAKEFLKLLPKVKQVNSRIVSSRIHHNLINQPYYMKDIIRNYNKGKNVEFDYSCNLFLEAGIRIERIDPDFPIEETVEMRTEPYPLPYKDYICLTVSGATMIEDVRKRVGVWSVNQWVSMIDSFYRTYNLKYPIVMIGANYDEKAMEPISNDLREKGIEIETYIDLPPINVCSIIKNSLYFIGYQCGLNVIADNFDVPQLIVYFPNLERMMYTWCKKRNIDNRIFNAVTFRQKPRQVVQEVAKQYQVSFW